MDATIIMSNYIFNTNTSVYSKLVYAAIKKFSNNEGKCFPSRNTLAELCSISISTLRKAVNSLVDANVLDKKFRYRENKSQTSNLYTLTPFMTSGEYYFKVRADIFELKLSGNEVVVYMYLCSCANKNNECYPSIRQVAEACGIGQTSVKITLKKLIDCNLINKINQFREDGGKRNNLYRIVIEDIENQIEPRPILEDAAAHEDEIIAEGNKIKSVDLYYVNEDSNLDNDNISRFEEIEPEENRKANIRDDIFDFKLSKNGLMVYFYISTFNALKIGKLPSYEQIGRRCKISRAKIDKAILELKNYGFINKLVQGEASNAIVISEPPPWAI